MEECLQFIKVRKWNEDAQPKRVPVDREGELVQSCGEGDLCEYIVAPNGHLS